jgi:hypothetical protein
MLKYSLKLIASICGFFLVCLALAWFDPFVGSPHANDMRSVFVFVGTLFAILAGFFISSLWDRFTRIRTLVAYETASLENIYKFCELIDPALAKRSAGLIDRYIIKALDTALVYYQENVREEYFSFYELLQALPGKGTDVPYTRLLNIFDLFAKSRKEILSRVKDKLGIHQWITLSLLSFLIAIFWLHLQFPGAIGILVGSILLFSIGIILYIVHDLNNPRWGGERPGIKVYDINVEVYERVYDVMNIPRYYPEELLQFVRLPACVRAYRVGVIVDKKTGERECSTVTVK